MPRPRPPAAARQAGAHESGPIHGGKEGKRRRGGGAGGGHAIAIHDAVRHWVPRFLARGPGHAHLVHFKPLQPTHAEALLEPFRERACLIHAVVPVDQCMCQRHARGPRRLSVVVTPLRERSRMRVQLPDIHGPNGAVFDQQRVQVGQLGDLGLLRARGVAPYSVPRSWDRTRWVIRLSGPVGAVSVGDAGTTHTRRRTSGRRPPTRC